VVPQQAIAVKENNMIGESQLSGVLALNPSQFIQNPFSGSAFGAIHSAMGNLPSLADFDTAMTNASGVAAADIAALRGHLSDMLDIHSGGGLQSMDQITAQMTSQVMPTLNGVTSIPSQLFSYGTQTSTITQSIGVPNAMSMLSTAQSQNALNARLNAVNPGSAPSACAAIQGISDGIHAVQSSLGQLYGSIGSEINALESSIGSAVSNFANAVKNALPQVGPIDPITGLPTSIPGVPIASEVFNDIHSAISSATASVKSAISTVVNVVDSAAIAIENQMKIGIANAMSAIQSDPCFKDIASKMTSPALSSVLKSVI
jgi:hypothetical protein